MNAQHEHSEKLEKQGRDTATTLNNELVIMRYVVLLVNYFKEYYVSFYFRTFNEVCDGSKNQW